MKKVAGTYMCQRGATFFGSVYSSQVSRTYSFPQLKTETNIIMRVMNLSGNS